MTNNIKKEEFPSYIKQQIEKGNVILFLGSGFSKGSKCSEGKSPPSGEQLRNELCDEYLDGEMKEKPLITVANYAKNESSRRVVEQFIKDRLINLSPESYHRAISNFKWHSIFTTNYDLVLENAYSENKNRRQELAPILSDEQDFSEIIKDKDNLPYFKLHGCITNIGSEAPLTLTTEEYAKHKKNRIKLFRHLRDNARDKPIIFIGYSISDPNINSILFDLTDNNIERQMYVTVDPGLNEFDSRMWSSHRIHPIKATLEQFVSFLDGSIDTRKYDFSVVNEQRDNPIYKYIPKDISISPDAIEYINSELKFIHNEMTVTGVTPKDFYRGLDIGWGGIHQKLDVERRVCNRIISSTIDHLDEKSPTVILLKGFAGSGKTIVLKRFSWSMAFDFEEPLFYLNKGGVLRLDLVMEVLSSFNRRVILVIDDVLHSSAEFMNLVNAIKSADLNVLIIVSARNNEWNQDTNECDSLIDNTFELGKLSAKAIPSLIKELTKHKCFEDSVLNNYNENDLIVHFEDKLDKLLLVALHEVTSGKTFEEIIVDEFKRIVPTQAKIIYKDICTLNRLGVPVRAGLISRVSGIKIEDFNKHFLAPLEHVVTVFMDYYSRDYAYSSRHPYIAEIVFNHTIGSQEEKYEQIVRLASKMNLDYTSDNQAFRKIISGKKLATMFSDKSYALGIYDIFEKIGADSSHINHQKAMFEIHHSNGNLKSALSFIAEAKNQSEYGDTNRAIKHTEGTILRKLSRKEPNVLLKSKYRENAKDIFKELMSGKPNDSRNHVGYLYTLLDELNDMREATESLSDDEVFVDTVKKAQSTINKALQLFPSDTHVLEVEARLENFLQNFEKARELIEKAYSINSDNFYVTIRHARNLVKSNKEKEAIKILGDSLAKQPNNMAINFEIAKILISKNDEGLLPQIETYLKRSFAKFDGNYLAQLWYARHHYLYGDYSVANEIFSHLKSARISPAVKNNEKGIVLDSNNSPMIYSGYIKQDHGNFYFIYSNELRDTVFAHQDDFNDDVDDDNILNKNVSFNLVFTMKGPKAKNIHILK
ncbi:SIR2 family protein [Kangiella taiwanensis]|nr:SIR2 family protein [Kangiella taiwanensis]